MKTRPYPNGGGFIDGFLNASTAKAEVERVNKLSYKTEVTACYLGHESHRLTVGTRNPVHLSAAERNRLAKTKVKP